jgi:essential nuclear protein 1
MPRTKKASGKPRHDPLLIQLDEDKKDAQYGRVSQPGKRKKAKNSSKDDEESGEV